MNMHAQHNRAGSITSARWQIVSSRPSKPTTTSRDQLAKLHAVGFERRTVSLSASAHINHEDLTRRISL